MAGRDDFRFPRRYRIIQRAEFARVMNFGRRQGDQRLLIWAFPNRLPFPRLGLVVGRRHGDAVARNRLKRLLREAFRLTRRDLPSGFDLVCSPRVGVQPSLSELLDALPRLASILSRKFSVDCKQSGGDRGQVDATKPTREL